MSPVRHRALVVDHDVAIGRLTGAALAEHGFACDTTADDDRAGEMLAATPYDVVIVDLTMPNQRGQALVQDLLDRENRPLVIVYADAVEPEVAQELIGRGVDGVLSKPVDFDSLATKARSLLDGRRRHSPDAGSASSTSGTSAHRVSPALFDQKLGHVSHVLPISAAALDVYEMTQNLEWDLSQIAAAVQRDAALTTEVLRMANSSYYNPPGRPIVDLDEAVMRIGQKRVGELALSINALSSLTPAKIPWMDLELLWNRSMAAGIAMELLVDVGGHEEVAEGLFVSAIMHPLGRIVLAMLFPDQYSTMVAECGRTGATLRELERQTFPASHTDVMAQLLANWRIAPEVFIPLKFSLDEYSSLARLLEPMRTKAELVKVAILLGRLAVGRWESWDLVRFPPAAVLDRLGVGEVEQLIHQTRSDVSRLAQFHPGGKSVSKKAAAPVAQQAVAYCDFSGHGADLVKEFLPALGLQPQAYAASDLRLFEEPLIANCLGVDLPHFAAQRTNHVSVVVAEEAQREAFARYAPSIGLPNSFRRVQQVILARVAENAREAAAGRL